MNNVKKLRGVWADIISDPSESRIASSFYMTRLMKREPELYTHFERFLKRPYKDPSSTRQFKLRRKALLVGEPECHVCGASSWKDFIRDDKALPWKPWPRYCSLDCIHACKDIRDKVRETNMRKLGVPVSSQHPSVQAKMRATNQKRYGVDHVFSSEDVRNRIKKTMLERYGHDNAQRVPSIRRRTEETNLARYGHKNAAQNENVQKKMRETSRAHWGVDHYWQSDIAVESRRRTCLEIYGVDSAAKSPVIKRRAIDNSVRWYGIRHHMHDPIILARCMKSRYKMTPTVRDGREFLLQGYEPEAIDYLVQRHGAVIIEAGLTGCQPKSYYVINGKRKLYTPDAYVYLKGSPRVVEVKSTYYLGILPTSDSKLWDLNRKKARACVKDGHDYVLVIKHRKTMYVFHSFPSRREVRNRLGLKRKKA